MADTIFVEATDPESGRVILQEFDDSHPEGNVFLYGTAGVTEVGRTSMVQKRIEQGFLRKVSAPKPEPEPEPEPVAEDGDPGEDEDTGEVLTPAQKAAQTRAKNASK